jgi:hypothetical protein
LRHVVEGVRQATRKHRELRDLLSSSVSTPTSSAPLEVRRSLGAAPDEVGQ